MPYGLYISAQGAAVQSKRLEVLANNLANVDTPGFKRELALFRARLSEATEQGLDEYGSRSINDVSGGVTFEQTSTDFSAGRLKHTGLDADVAIAGDGFFRVDKDGEVLLTRAGNFSFDPAGRLVTQQGYSVLNSAGTPIVIDPESGPARIENDGRVYQSVDGNPIAIGEIGVVVPASLGDLVKTGENMFLALADVAVLPPDERQLRAGFLEQSGVEPTGEMIQLIEATRAMESNLNLIKNRDEMIGSLVNRLLRQS